MELSKSQVEAQFVIDGIRSEDEAVMEYVYRKYYPMIAHFVKSNSGNENDAEDLYQEGLLTVFQKIQSGENVLHLKTYIYAVCRFKWLHLLRYRRRHVETLVETQEFVEFAWDKAEDEPTPYEQVMWQALDRLDENCRQLLLSFYYDKLSMEEIAARFGYNQANTAKSKKNKCMDRVRDNAKAILKGLQI